MDRLVWRTLKRIEPCSRLMMQFGHETVKCENVRLSEKNEEKLTFIERRWCFFQDPSFFQATPLMNEFETKLEEQEWAAKLNLFKLPREKRTCTNRSLVNDEMDKHTFIISKTRFVQALACQLRKRQARSKNQTMVHKLLLT